MHVIHMHVLDLMLSSESIACLPAVSKENVSSPSPGESCTSAELICGC